MDNDIYGTTTTTGGNYSGSFRPMYWDGFKWVPQYTPTQKEWQTPSLTQINSELWREVLDELSSKGAKMLTGTKHIVLQKSNGTSTAVEYDSLDIAVKDASRLCAKTDDEYIVYMPVKIVRPKSDVIVDDVAPPK